MGFFFFKTVYNVPSTFYKPMGLDLQKYKKLTRINRGVKMTLKSVILLQKCNKVHIH